MATEKNPTPTLDTPAPEVDPLTPIVDEKNFDSLTLLSTLVPGGVLRLHRPTVAEEPQVRFLVRKIARSQGVNPDDIDAVTYDTYFMAALFQLCVDEPEGLDFFAFKPKSRKEQNALQQIGTEVLTWIAQFRDEDVVVRGAE